MTRSISIFRRCGRASSSPRSCRLSRSEQGVRDGPLELFLAQLTDCTALDPYDDAFVAGADLVATGVTAVHAFFHSLAPAAEYRAALVATALGLSASGIAHELVVG